MIHLQPLSATNFDHVIALAVGPDQTDFVATNLLSIAQSKVYTYLVPNVIYLDEIAIGFSLHGKDPDTGRVFIVRLMIDHRFQRRGHGKAATLLLIGKLRASYQVRSLFVSIVPANHPADHLYRSLGFLPTGERDEDGEIIMQLAEDSAG